MPRQRTVGRGEREGRRRATVAERPLLGRLYSTVRSGRGALSAGPWLDTPSLWGVTRLYMPLSRLWASANHADGSVERFLDTVPMRAPRALDRRLTRLLARQREAARAAASTEVLWREAFFGGGDILPPMLRRINSDRLGASETLMLQRLRFVDLLPFSGFRAVRFEVPTPQQVDELLGPFAAQPEMLYHPPGILPVVEVSRPLAGRRGEERWLRFPSPSPLGDTAWARVREPEGGPGQGTEAPTLIFCSGVCMELDQWEVESDIASLCEQGIRVIEVTPPWHGRRALPGYYGGEPFFAMAPLGPVRLFSALAQEFGVLVAWARREYGGPVGIGGLSMGAIAAKLALLASNDWPAESRPDALLAITLAGDIAGLAFDSALTRAIGLPRALHDRGWTDADLVRLNPLAAIDRPLPLPPERIVAVLGLYDEVLPYQAARRMLERWKVPPENLFIRRQGHFSLPLGLSSDPRPLERIAAVLRAAGT